MLLHQLIYSYQEEYWKPKDSYSKRISFSFHLCFVSIQEQFYLKRFIRVLKRNKEWRRLFLYPKYTYINASILLINRIQHNKKKRSHSLKKRKRKEIAKEYQKKDISLSFSMTSFHWFIILLVNLWVWIVLLGWDRIQ